MLADTEAVEHLHKEPIHHLYFKPNVDTTVGHAQATFGDRTVGMSEQALQLLLEHAKAAKKEATGWGDQAVQQMIIGHMRQLGHDNIYTWRDVKECWKQNGNEDAARSMWDACCGCFDRKPGWEVELESKYMAMKHLTYHAEKGESKGCFAKLFSNSKCTRVKAINRVGGRSHGGLTRVQRTKEEVAAGKRFKKRRKGTTLGGFATIGGKEIFEPEKKVSLRLQ